MSKNWTDKQKLAIETHGKTLLVSAAAGSGKTATLTERIVRSITDENNPADISKMLIVTFTRLSAADLKRKISNAISEELAKNPTSRHLSKQLVLLESAHICTIDSFYLDIVRENFQRLNLPSNFRLADEGEMALIRREVMDSIIEKHYDNSKDDDGFLTFVENFTSTKQSDSLAEVFLDLENKLSSSLLGINTIYSVISELKSDLEKDFFESRQGEIIQKYFLGASKSYYASLCYACDVIAASPEASRAYLSAFAYEKEFYKELTEILEKKSYAQAREKLLSFNKQKLGALKSEFKTDDIVLCKALRDEEVKFIPSVAKKYFSFDEDQIKGIMRQTIAVLESLFNVFSEFQAEALAQKIKRRVFGFDDIRYFTYLLLKNENGEASGIAIAYREKFDEIYIDEYQDVDAMQDMIFTLISKDNNRFMVGDIKQSIYSFRGADTDVFSGYKKTFPPLENAENSDSALIFMSNNFRCDENVIEFTNKVFSFLFTYCGESIEYSPKDDLIFSKVEEGRTLPSPYVNVTVITGDESAKEDDEPNEEENQTDINAEALWIASEINRLIKFEKKADGSAIEPRDIAVLMRSTTPAADITKALELYNVPCSDNSKYDLFETPDVLLVISLLSCIDNPHRDIPLAATLFSPIFAYEMNELIEIKSVADPSESLFEALRNYSGKNESIKAKNRYFIEKLTQYRACATYLPIDKLINHIYRDLSMFALSSANEQNLKRLYEMARKFEASSFKGLGNFISYINELIENDKVPSLTYEDADNNCVQMITVHKSKGLEFPVCFICNTQSKFNLEDIKPNMLYHPRAGIALKLAYHGGMVRLNTPLREAVALEMTNAQIEEEMRILYVALTRARERLYITAHTRSKFEKLCDNAHLTHQFASDFTVKKCKNWLSMVLAAIYPLESGKSYIFTALEKNEVAHPYKNFENGELCSDSYISITDEDVKTIKSRLDFKYPYEHLNKLPAKLSVSKLTPTVLDDMDDDAATLESFDEAKILEIEEFFESKSKTSSADRGTATHLFLQFCNFENAEKNGAKTELDRLVENKFIAPQVASLINLTQIEKFFESDFYKVFKNAKKVYREQRFNIMLPASHFTEDKDFKAEITDENILIQGVIDLFFESDEGKIILCDYKTDYLTHEELKSEALVKEKMRARHGKQLEYYSMAIERFLGKKPDEILIYSLPFGEAVEI